MAQAVLLEDVEKLGRRGDPIDVAPGYLRNYLIPRKLAQPATPGALEEAQRRREAAEKAERERAAREAEAASLLSKTVLTIHQRAGEDGKLFGSVGPKEIVDAIARPATCGSTNAKSASSSRSARSAPTWSRSSSPTAPPPR